MDKAEMIKRAKMTYMRLKQRGPPGRVVLPGIGTRDGDGTNCTAFIEVFADSVAIVVANR
ncbi:MAG: hypothetical protein SCK70_17085 [bacterium]|nr:hypothetical protein [bacterium]